MNERMNERIKKSKLYKYILPHLEKCSARPWSVVSKFRFFTKSVVFASGDSSASLGISSSVFDAGSGCCEGPLEDSWLKGVENVSSGAHSK